MKFDNPQHQNIYDSFEARLDNLDAAGIEQSIQELQEDPRYTNPADENHEPMLHVLPLLIGRQMQLAGQDPHAITGRARGLGDSNFAEADDYDRAQEANRAREYLKQMQESGADEVDIQEAQKLVIELETNKATRDAATDKEAERMTEQEEAWRQEADNKRNQMKAEFMEAELRNVPKEDQEKIRDLAETKWSNLVREYGF